VDYEPVDDPENRRPALVTILALGVLTVGVWFLTRAGQSVQFWELNRELSLTVSPGYLFLSGLILGLAGLISVWRLWLGHTQAARSTFVFAMAVALAYWLDRLFLSVSETRQVNSSFAVAATAIILIVVSVVLRLPGVRRFFER
jgi:hypothetical protein